MAVMHKTVSIIVSGKVQGVYYRQSAREKATELGVTGYVLNQPDGSVAITATGTTEQLEKLIAWCHQGPRLARVTRVDVKEVSLASFGSFTIER